MTPHPVIHGHDAEDLEVLSARFQDALVRPSDLIYKPDKGLFVMLANRFMWEKKPQGWLNRRWFRVRAGLHFTHVIDVKTRGLVRPPGSEGDDVLNLLAMSSLPADPHDPENPERVVSLHFSGGATVRLHVECPEASSRDMGDPWPTPNRPDHETVA